MKTKRLTRWADVEILAVLDELLGGSGFRVLAKVRLKDVVGPEPGESLSAEDWESWTTAHLDFVVCDHSHLSPILAVQLDGPQHDNESQSNRDIRKNRFCADAKLPLLRIRGPHLDRHDQASPFEFMLSRFVS